MAGRPKRALVWNLGETGTVGGLLLRARFAGGCRPVEREVFGRGASGNDEAEAFSRSDFERPNLENLGDTAMVVGWVFTRGIPEQL